MARDKAYINPEKCKECGQCFDACPYNAIVDIMRPCRRACPVDAIQADEDGRVWIDDEKCIRCGSCISKCPFGAISMLPGSKPKRRDGDFAKEER